jgi:hypothetical protein
MLDFFGYIDPAVAKHEHAQQVNQESYGCHIQRDAFQFRFQGLVEKKREGFIYDLF